ncbi:Lipase [Macleaya cordata]|uniref:Lipase n=1 Tax=Macleaya cordata TaxID=56857 RepID=A0A200QFD6_MACCD|nr:Lipase [Macleaya cordata]
MAASTTTIQNLHINHLISVKLDETNYLLWLTQFKPLLKGYKHQGLSTSREVWIALEKRFAPKTRAHHMHLRQELQTLRNGNKIMQQYFSFAKQLFDALAASGNPITDNDLQQAILSGLDQSYDAIVTSLTTLITVDMDEFFAHLLTYDMRLELQMASLQQPIANVATTNRAFDSRSQTFDRSATRSSNRGHNQPRSRSNNTQQPHLQGPCQLCAESVGLPLLPPYLGNSSHDFRQGVNFAVKGATALDASFFVEKQIHVETNLSLGSLIEQGAVTLVVPGNLPIGCSSIYLTLFESPNKDDYSARTGCLKWLNKFSKYHNKLLQNELDRLRALHPHTNIIYADYYNAAMRLYHSPNQLGFKRGALRACCGGGGPYNYNSTTKCGEVGSELCDDPSLYVAWDGIHLTEAAYRVMAAALLQDHQITNSVSYGCYKSIFSFGDSLTDTGNRLYWQGDKPSSIGQFPYGETFFHRPTGRYCDGRLIVDFIAESLGLPLLPPYLGNSSHDFRQGVNFAVGGATALNASFFIERQIHVETNFSLGVQLDWFRQLLPSLCDPSSSNDCLEFLSKSLFLVGEIGGNDYNHPFFERRSLAEIQTFVPKVIDAISFAINSLIQQGAVTLVVPGNLPIGCSSIYLTKFESPNKDEYSAMGCLKWLNKFSKYHNKLLQKELDRLRVLHPHTNIIYADYYNAAMQFYRSPNQLGFKSGALTACCGGGGPYNYNSTATCGKVGSELCDDPSWYVSWDGIHLTEAAYRIIATALLQDHQITNNLSCAYSLPRHFGDSLTDTGNLLYSQGDNPSNIGRLPYGETYFHRPTGRSPDGRLVIDFIAHSVGLPLLRPYLLVNRSNNNHEFRQGVNFAVAGATAMDVTFFEERNISTSPTNYSLGVLNSADDECFKFFSRSLFVVGEIGANDYNSALFHGKTLAEIRTFVPKVINTITSTIDSLIKEGAVTFLVPVIIPMGCAPIFLTNFKSMNKDDYDASTGCLEWPNKFRRGALRACCGGGGPYNFNSSIQCGNVGSNVCDDPSLQVSWNGIHLTEAAYRVLATALLKESFGAFFSHRSHAS